jgi:uncharacterized protein
LKRFWLILIVLFSAVAARADEVIPAKPAHYFNDYANVVSAATAAQLNQQLEDFEKSNSSQIVVAVYPKMQSDSSIEDYTVRVAQSWHVGQAGKDNGAVLFVFIADHKMYLQVGYGLEGKLPDALAKGIIENEIKPRFKNGDYDGGLRAGVAAILAGAMGEYTGTGTTVAGRHAESGQKETQVIVLLVFIVVIFLIIRASSSSGLAGFLLGGGGYRRSGGFWSSGGFGGGGFGGGGGGGFSGGGGGGFSSGGGNFGGGGAGGSW